MWLRLAAKCASGVKVETLTADSPADPVDAVRAFVEAACSENARGPLYIFIREPPDRTLAGVLGWVAVDRRLQATVVAPEDTLESPAHLELLQTAGARALYVTFAGARQQDTPTDKTGRWRSAMRVLLTAQRLIPRVHLGAHLMLSPEYADTLPRVLELLRRVGDTELLLWDPGCGETDGAALSPPAALGALDFALITAQKLGVCLQPVGFERTKTAEAPTPASPCIVTGAVVQLLRDGVPLPSAGVGLLASDGKTAAIREAASSGDAVAQLAFELGGRGFAFLDLPACLGGAPPEDSALRHGVKVDACRRCPIEPRCAGVPHSLMATIPGILEAIAPPPHWIPMPDRIRAVVCCTPAYDAIYGGTFVSLALWLARLGARVDIVTPWGLIPQTSTSSAEVQPPGSPEGLSAVEKLMIDGPVDEYDLIVTPDPKVTRPLVVNRRLREGTRLAITDFHMLGGMTEWVRDLCAPGRRPQEGGWWPSDQIMLYSAFPGYTPLYTSYGIPMRQVAWQPYALDPERFVAEMPATAGTTIVSAGHHRRDLGTLLSAAARLSSNVHPIDLFAPGEVPDVPRQIRFHGTVPPHLFCPQVGRSRFMVVPLVADPHNAAGITALVTAIVYGRPLIVTDTAGARDYVVEGVNGLLVPPSDPQAMAEAIERLDTDAALLAKLAEGARQAAGHFTTETWARALLHGSRNYDAGHWAWTKWRTRFSTAGPRWS